MDWEKIGEEFDKSLIKRRKGAFGMVSYVGMAEYIKRLNQIFEYQWSFGIVDSQILDGFVIVQGRLEAQGVTKMQYGTSRVTVSIRSGEKTQIGDDFKAAASDCLKKCASFFGIGLYLYDSDAESGTEVAASPLLRRIVAGELKITELVGSDVDDLRKQLWLYDKTVEEGTHEELTGYCDILLKEYDTVSAVQEETDGGDA